MARTSALEETYEALIGNDGSLTESSQNLLTSASDLKARQDIICEQVCTKGQLISKCHFGVIVWTKIPTKFFPGFLP